VVVLLANTEQTGCAVHLLAEINVVNLVHVSFVHIPSKHRLQDVLGGCDLQEVQHSKELDFSDMAVPCAIEILEQWLQVNASNLNSSSVFVQYKAKFAIIGVTTLKVLAACKQCVILSNGWHTACWHLVNSSSCECLVNRLAECNIVKEPLGIISFVF